MTAKRRVCAAVLLLLALAWHCSADALAKTSATRPVSPAVAAKLRSLLPFPEDTLRQTMEMSIGLGNWPGEGCRLKRIGNDGCATDSVAVRRNLTGGIADAPRYRTLGGLYRRAGLPKKASAAYAESAAICQNALHRNPRDGYALAEYGRTLMASGQAAQAEIYLRGAAKLAPESADVQLTLGLSLTMQAKPGTSADAHFVRDAVTAYDRAVSLASYNPTVWTARGDFRMMTLPMLQVRPTTQDGLSDYIRAAALSPHDPYAQARVPDAECFLFETRHGLYTSPEAAKAEPQDSNLRANTALRHLTEIAQSARGRKSAAAYDARAWVQFEYFYDVTGTQNSLHLALLQDPADDGARDYQMHVAAVNGDFALLAAFCRKNLKRTPSVRLRIVLAYADYFIAQQKPSYWREGLTQIELAHAAKPRDYALSLGLAAMLLKSGQSADQARAALLLDRIAPQSAKHPKPQQAEYDLTCGISAALGGELPTARRSLARALQNDPQNPIAKSALALLPE